MNDSPRAGQAGRSHEHVGLCARCRHAQLIRSPRSSVFWRCRRSETDPAYPRYPRLPVLACKGFDAADADPRK